MRFPRLLSHGARLAQWLRPFRNCCFFMRLPLIFPSLSNFFNFLQLPDS